MLGKTNITALSEGAIVTEIEDYNWIQMQSGIFGNFVKAIYKNGYLVGITADGVIAYTTDGEAWQTHTFEYEDCKLNDVDWDGSRFIFVGSYMGTSPLESENAETVQRGLVIVTSDFATYEAKEIGNDMGGYISEYFLIYPANGKYIVIAKITEPRSTRNGKAYGFLGNLEDEWVSKVSLEYHPFAKNSKDIIAFYSKAGSGIVYYKPLIIRGNDASTQNLDENFGGDLYNIKAFECKDELYVMTFGKTLYKMTSSYKFMLMSSEKDFAFVDGVYFDDSRLFINAHEMLVVKKGENIADKTLEDLIEIAPELTMNCITKAFGQLYIFGNQGVILRSSVETNNTEAVTVQTISAKKALLDAKKYTDERYAALEARIAALEGGAADDGQ